MKIRILEPEDAINYKEIRLEALKTNPEAYSSSYEEQKSLPLEFFKKRLTLEHFFIFGAFEEDNLIGIVTLILETGVKTKHKAHIVAMYVYPGKRNSGVGRALMLEAIKKAKEIEGVEQLYLTVTSNNEPAKNLYQILGFEKIKNTYFDDELMVLYL